MIREQLYNKTVDLLSTAYMNDTLVCHHCGCGVGNLIAGNMNLQVMVIGEKACWIRNDNQVQPFWHNVFHTQVGKVVPWGKMRIKEFVDASKYEGEAKRQIDSTGYSPEELRKIEMSFSRGYVKKKKMEDKIFSALMSMVDMLDEIHQNTDVTVNQVSKQKFRKHGFVGESV